MVAPIHPESKKAQSEGATRPSPTPRQRRANRRNAQRSTGPRTPQGKARSAKNAITHGIFCCEVILPGENRPLFLRLRNDFIRRLKPQDLLELSLVDRIAIAQWKLNRAQAAETQVHLGCGTALRERMADRLDTFLKMHHVKRPFDLLTRGPAVAGDDDDPRNDPRRDDAVRADDLDLYNTAEEMQFLAELDGYPGAATLAIIARGDRIDLDEPRDDRGRRLARGLDEAALDRLAHYQRTLQCEISRCLRDLTTLRKQDLAGGPPSPFERDEEQLVADAADLSARDADEADSHLVDAAAFAADARAAGAPDGDALDGDALDGDAVDADAVDADIVDACDADAVAADALDSAAPDADDNMQDKNEPNSAETIASVDHDGTCDDGSGTIAPPGAPGSAPGSVDRS